MKIENYCGSIMIMQMSNDIKWNKIKEIEKLLSHYWWERYYEGTKLSADRETWVLANKLYDIATEGLYIEPDKYDWIEQPEHWCDIVDRVNGLPEYNNHPVIAYHFRDSYWERYDYANS